MDKGTDTEWEGEPDGSDRSTQATLSHKGSIDSAPDNLSLCFEHFAASIRSFPTGKWAVAKARKRQTNKRERSQYIALSETEAAFAEKLATDLRSVLSQLEDSVDVVDLRGAQKPCAPLLCAPNHSALFRSRLCVKR